MDTRGSWMAELYEANSTAVYRVCQRLLKNTDDAADATQQVFLIALESLDLKEKKSAARAWLLTVARNHCLDLLRRRKRLGKALVTLGSDAGRGTDLETAVADRDFVGIVFKQLSKRERQALWQSAVESRPLADIAGTLRVSYMAAAQVLHRARRHAVQVAARVAVAVGVFQLGRQRPGVGSVLVTRLAAAAAVPLILVSMNASSPLPQPGSAALPAVSAAGPTSAAGALQTSHPNPAPQGARETAGIPNSLLPASTAPLNSALDTVRQLLRPLPTVPPVVGEPHALPSVPAGP